MTDLNNDQRAIAEECDAIKAMLLEKNRNYGSSALDPVRVFSKASSVEQILVRLDDKLSRLARGNEADEDVILDLLGYLVLLRIARKRQAPKHDLQVHLMDETMASSTRCGVSGSTADRTEHVTCGKCLHSEGLVQPVQTVHLIEWSAWVKAIHDSTDVLTFCGKSAFKDLRRGQGTTDPERTTCPTCKDVYDIQHPGKVPLVQTVHIGGFGPALCGYFGPGKSTSDPMAATCVECKRVYEEKSK